MKYSVDELKDIYEEKYDHITLSGAEREKMIYKKYRKLLINDGSYKTGNSVLDLGCGLGFKTVGFHRDGERTLAIDLSQNAIQFCQNTHKSSEIEFKAMDAYGVEGNFQLITAFGFSLFNTPDNQEFLDNVGFFLQKNLSSEKGSTMIIGSFTDFSGGGKESWYLHTKKDLELICRELSKSHQVKVDVIFPHRKLDNFIGFGGYNLLAEFYKLIWKRRRTFFIRICHE